MKELLDKIALGLDVGAVSDETCNTVLESWPGRIDPAIIAGQDALAELTALLNAPPTNASKVVAEDGNVVFETPVKGWGGEHRAPISFHYHIGEVTDNEKTLISIGCWMNGTISLTVYDPESGKGIADYHVPIADLVGKVCALHNIPFKPQ